MKPIECWAPWLNTLLNTVLILVVVPIFKYVRSLHKKLNGKDE